MKQAERIYKRTKIIGKDIPLKTLNLVPLTLAYPSVEMDFFINIENDFTSLVYHKSITFD